MKEKILNVLYQSNDFYAPVTGVSLISLLVNNRHFEKINVYILNDNISSENISKLKKIAEDYQREIVFLNTESILNKLKELRVSPFKGTYTTYFKLMALKDLNVEGDRILQLDGDTIINAPLDELLEINLDNNLLAATYDCTLAEYKKLIDIPIADKYYNCGVLYINQKKWVDEKCEDRIIHHLKHVRRGYYTVDQDILNVLFREQFVYLDIKFNFNSGFYIYGIKGSLKLYNLKDDFYNMYEEIQEVFDHPILYHCMGAMTGRPWEKNSIHPQNELFDQYLNQSPWAGMEKAEVKRHPIFRFQRLLYLILPLSMYIPIHKVVHMYYLKNQNRKVLEDTHSERFFE